MRVDKRACVFDPVEVLKLSEFELCRFVSAAPKKSSFFRRERESVYSCNRMRRGAVCSHESAAQRARREKTNLRLKLYNFTWLHGR